MKKKVLMIILILISIALIALSMIFAKTWPKGILYALEIVGSLLFLGAIASNYRKPLSVKEITLIAIQAAISIVLYYYVKFNLPFFPPWLDIQVSEIPALISGFIYGPYVGCIVIVIRFLVKLPVSTTVGVGEICDLILGVILVLITSIIYQKNRTLKGAIKGTVIGLASCTLLACFINYSLLIPAYIDIAGFPIEALAGMLDKIMSFEVTPSNFMVTYIFLGALPFNILRYIIVALITFLLYKKLHILISRITKKKEA